MRNRKRMLLVPGLLAVLGALGFTCVAWWTAPPKHNIHPKTVEEIRSGMTEVEVQAFLDVSTGNHTPQGFPAVVRALLAIVPGVAGQCRTEHPRGWHRTQNSGKLKTAYPELVADGSTADRVMDERARNSCNLILDKA
jgi:hypothetical protein